MLDIKFIRQNPEIVKKAISDRNYKFDLGSFLELDSERRKIISQIEELKALQNKISAELRPSSKKQDNLEQKKEKSKSIKQEIIKLEEALNTLEAKFYDKLYRIPNIPHVSLPVGDSSKNKIVKECGSKREFNFRPLDHIALAERLNLIDFKRAAKITGSNFILFTALGAQLERALINFMLDIHTKQHGYVEVSPSKIVNRESMFTTGQLPNLEEDMYSLKNDDLFLIPTAEVPLTNIYRDEIIEENSLPLKYVSYTPCFRREAGSYGKDTRGLMRVHEFDKVELVKFVKPESSYNELEKLLNDACSILDFLKLPYRIVMLATADISFASSKCYDIELYAPGIDKWLEVSSCSNFEDFQARRGNIKYKDKKSQKNSFLHTLNGSGVALPRLIVSLLENHQQEDGSVIIPEPLRRYLDGRERITK
jgi:seryl-tRNA synthetase